MDHNREWQGGREDISLKLEDVAIENSRGTRDLKKKKGGCPSFRLRTLEMRMGKQMIGLPFERRAKHPHQRLAHLIQHLSLN